MCEKRGLLTMFCPKREEIKIILLLLLFLWMVSRIPGFSPSPMVVVRRNMCSSTSRMGSDWLRLALPSPHDAQGVAHGKVCSFT